MVERQIERLLVILSQIAYTLLIPLGSLLFSFLVT